MIVIEWLVGAQQGGNEMKSVTMVRFIATLAIVLSCSVKPAWSKAPEGGYTFGIGPVQSATELAKRWTPFLEYVSQKSGVPLQFKTTNSLTAFQEQFTEGVFDFGLLNPYHYIVSNKARGYTAFAREKNAELFALLIVQKDSPIQGVSQLEGKTLAFPSATAFIGTWVQVDMLNNKNISVTRQYVNSMDSSYRSVAKGLFPAGGGESRTWGTLDPEVKSQLRILWTSDPFPPFAFMSHPRVPKSDVSKVVRVMEQMDTDPQSIELLKGINLKGIEKSSDAAYNGMRKMNFKPVEDKQ